MEAKPATPSKQEVTLNKLKAAWQEKKVDLSKLEAKPDGKFLNVIVGAGWPIVRIGAAGGIELPQIRSYAKAFDAAVDGLAIFQKQQARDAKRTAPAAPAPAVKPEQKKEETPTAKKRRQEQALEAQLA